MKPKTNIAHLLRKSDHFNSTPFIRNQIVNHINYSPYLAIKENHAGIKNTGEIKYFILSTIKDWFHHVNYKLFRNISKHNVIELSEFCMKNKINLLHFHYGTDAGIFHPFLKSTTIPSVVSFYGYDCSSFPKRFLGLGKFYLRKRVFKHVTKILAMSNDMKKDLINLGCPEEKIIVHYFGIDIQKFIIAERVYLPKEKLQLLIMASLEERKGHNFLLQSLLLLIKNGVYNLKLEIIGKGYLEMAIKKFIIDNDISNYVNFIPSVNYYNSEINDAFKRADIYIQPSITVKNGDKEGIPTALLEAMATGLPVVSTYHAGIPDMITHNINGLLVNEWDVEGLSEAIKSLIENREKRERLGKEAARFVNDNIALEIKEKELEDIYTKLIKTGRETEKCAGSLV